MDHYNNHDEFIGVDEILDLHHNQYIKFVQWYEQKKWHMFHTSHYDWWSFPVCDKSGFGYKYSVYEEEIYELKKEPEFIREYLHGAELLACSWGWDLNHSSYIDNPDQEQCWQNWPIRLKKAIHSLFLFHYPKQAESLLVYANALIKQGHNWEYRG